jgi:hypothetical protein
VPLKSRLKEDIVSHIQRKSHLYLKAPLRSINFAPIEDHTKVVTDYLMKTIKHGKCGWEDVSVLPRVPRNFPGKYVIWTKKGVQVAHPALSAKGTVAGWPFYKKIPIELRRNEF